MIAIPPLTHVTGVEVIGEHDLRLSFEDGTVGDGLDMAPEPLYADAKRRQVTRQA